MFAGKILAGALLLVLGRKLFWLYVAILGFAAGLSIASHYFQAQPEWVQLVIGIVFGLIGAALAYFFQGIAVAVAGFLAGAYLALSLVATPAASARGDGLAWILFLVGGVIGAVLAIMLFDWALIILSSLTGALMVTQGLNLADGPVGWLVVAGLAVLGIIIQSRMEQPTRPQRTTRSASI